MQTGHTTCIDLTILKPFYNKKKKRNTYPNTDPQLNIPTLAYSFIHPTKMQRKNSYVQDAVTKAYQISV